MTKNQIPPAFALLASCLNLRAQEGLQPIQAPPGAIQVLPEQEYSQISKHILDRILALKNKYSSLSNMVSANHYEYNVVWVLDDKAKPPSKLNGRREIFGRDGYWFSLQFFRGKWQGAAVFRAIEFGDLNVWFDFGHGGNAAVIKEITTILREENAAFCKTHPWQPPNVELKITESPK
jgi:hypothetical protein